MNQSGFKSELMFWRVFLNLIFKLDQIKSSFFCIRQLVKGEAIVLNQNEALKYVSTFKRTAFKLYFTTIMSIKSLQFLSHSNYPGFPNILPSSLYIGVLQRSLLSLQMVNDTVECSNLEPHIPLLASTHWPPVHFTVLFRIDLFV